MVKSMRREGERHAAPHSAGGATRTFDCCSAIDVTFSTQRTIDWTMIIQCHKARKVYADAALRVIGLGIGVHRTRLRSLFASQPAARSIASARRALCGPAAGAPQASAPPAPASPAAAASSAARAPPRAAWHCRAPVACL
jgi:hypothetical protein